MENIKAKLEVQYRALASAEQRVDCLEKELEELKKLIAKRKQKIHNFKQKMRKNNGNDI